MFAEHMHIYVGRGMSQAGGATSHPGQNAPAAAAGGKLSDRKTVSTGGQQDITVQTGYTVFVVFTENSISSGFEPHLMAAIRGFAERKCCEGYSHTPDRCKWWSWFWE